MKGTSGIYWKGRGLVTLTEELQAGPVAIQIEESGVYRIGDARVPRETFVPVFENGGARVEILDKYRFHCCSTAARRELRVPAATR